MMKRILIYVIIILGLLAIVGMAAAYDTGFATAWWTVDGGGGTSSGGNYSMSGTAGQPDAGQMNGGTYTLDGGYWPGGVPAVPQVEIYLPTTLSP